MAENFNRGGRQTRDHFPMSLDKVVRVKVPRPRKSQSKREKEEEEEVLVIDEIKVRKDVFAKFDVLINEEEEVEDDQAACCRAHKTEFAGSFVNVPCKRADDNTGGVIIKTKKTRLRLGIGELLRDLGAEDDEDVLVTLVPKCGCGSVTIGGIKIELEA